MEITVTVDSISLDTIVDTVLGVDEDGDEYTAGERTVAGHVAAQIVAKIIKDDRWPRLRDQVLEIRKEEIRAAVRPSIDEALSRPIHKTNSYGETQGAATTLAEIIADEARKWITEPADRHRSDKGTLLQNAVRTEVTRAFQAEIADAVKQARDAVTKEIGDQVGQQITEAVRKGIAAR
jgi:hypothetical protein